MSLPIISSTHSTYTQKTTSNSMHATSEIEVQATTPAASSTDVPQDKVEISGGTVPEKPNIYSKPTSNTTKLSSEQIESILAESQQKTDEFMNLIRGLVTKQGLDFSKVVRGEQKLTVEDPKVIEEAKAAIADDGEFGVKNMAEHILSFAKSLISGDPSKMDLIRDSIKKGFDAAKDVLGGELPDISKKTYDVIMQELDRWQTDGIPTGDVNITI